MAKEKTTEDPQTDTNVAQPKKIPATTKEWLASTEVSSISKEQVKAAMYSSYQKLRELSDELPPDLISFRLELETFIKDHFGK